ncbi:MAG: AAA family ATPase [Myxococcales bacterium]|nr:AAA family ATPase [Myxococcales bacterium]
MLSPILNALRPEVLALVNGKSREVLAFLTGEKVSNAIADYPTTSRLVLEVTEDLGAILDGAGPAELTRLDRFDMFCHWVVAVKGFGPRDAKYWKIAPGEGGFLWDRCREGGYIAVGWDELGDVSALTKSQFDERRDALRAEHPEWTKHGLNQVWRFSQIQEGDRIVANKGWSEVLAVGTVTSGYYFAPDGDYRHRVAVDWYDVTRRQISKHGWSMTLAQIDRADFEEVAGAPPIVEVGGGDDAGGADPGHARPVLRAAYALEDLAQETYQELDEVARWVRAVGRKKQMIFFGPPGTGKTFCAKRLARHLVERTAGFVETVQFHPSYGYEDFIEGIRPRPTDAGGLSYALVKGRFLDACERASRSTDPCVLIIDEINRANLSRVFGELMYLLEYRNDEIPLASGTPFRMPANLLLIGTMNTADRSIALIDHALRRRFAFVRLPPCFEGLRRYHAEHETTFEPAGLIAVLERLNRTIGDPNYAVGVSFFMHEDAVEQMPDIWQMEIEPYLDEYFFDRPTLVDEFRWARVGAAILGG